MGVPLCSLSSNFQRWNVIKRPVANHGEQDCETSVGQCDERLIMTLALSSFPVIVLSAGRIKSD